MTARRCKTSCIPLLKFKIVILLYLDTINVGAPLIHRIHQVVVVSCNQLVVVRRNPLVVVHRILQEELIID